MACSETGGVPEPPPLTYITNKISRDTFSRGWNALYKSRADVLGVIENELWYWDDTVRLSLGSGFSLTAGASRDCWSGRLGGRFVDKANPFSFLARLKYIRLGRR